jgi:hypothetical protein
MSDLETLKVRMGLKAEVDAARLRLVDGTLVGPDRAEALEHFNLLAEKLFALDRPAEEEADAAQQAAFAASSAKGDAWLAEMQSRVVVREALKARLAAGGLSEQEKEVIQGQLTSPDLRPW